MKALQMIGNLFEVGAFLERKESTIIHKSSDIRTRLLERLGKVSDVKAKQDDGLTLMQEIRGDGTSDVPARAPTAPVGGLCDAVHAHDLTHTVSLIQTPDKKEGAPPSKNPEVVHDFDKE
jgi:hypothetical protein